MAREKTFSFGACEIAKYSPKKEKWSPDTKVLNVIIGFEEALKLNLALSQCLMEVNKLKRSTKEGKRAGVNLILHLAQDRIAVAEGKI